MPHTNPKIKYIVAENRKVVALWHHPIVFTNNDRYRHKNQIIEGAHQYQVYDKKNDNETTLSVSKAMMPEKSWRSFENIIDNLDGIIKIYHHEMSTKPATGLHSCNCPSQTWKFK